MADVVASTDTGRPAQGVSRPVERRRFSCALVGAALSLGLSLSACSQGGPGADAVSLETARAEHEAGRVLMIDIREPHEHATGVAAGAKLLPMRQLAQRLAEIPTDAKQPVLLICNTQNRSKATLKALREQGGYSHVRYVDGGMSEWARRGWPMVAPGR
ncbi:rhodanese-like domain-containing protein [Roseateles sp.]|jgi:rhodanese-related sulfurtransferase|uniref:rhodanese-like domain-containing protein n=1 Tax=Roseateles sp. TaxID=1971397 RepID=UPI0037C8D006